MFELFGSDSDKKEEIDKNMDKIKDMVGSSSNADRPSETQSPGQARQQDLEGSQRAPRPAGEQENPSSPGPVQAEGRQPPQSPSSPKSGSPGTQNPSSGPQPVQDRPEQPSQDRSTDSQEPDRDSVTPQRPESPPARSTDQQETGPSRQETPTDRDSRQETAQDEQPEPEPEEETEPEPPKRQEIPEAPQTREIEVPDIEKGPLFIRVKKFKEAKKMIHEMQDLADDVETDMGGLQNTLEEDKDVQKDLKGRLKKLRDSMKSIHTIVSP